MGRTPGECGCTGRGRRDGTFELCGARECDGRHLVPVERVGDNQGALALFCGPRDPRGPWFGRDGVVVHTGTLSVPRPYSELPPETWPCWGGQRVNCHDRA